MNSIVLRLRSGVRAALLHLCASILVGCFAAVVVFFVWYPSPYGYISGGRELFYLLVVVDIICGPLLTLILFNSAKPRRELLMDLSLVVVIQLVALIYGLYTVYVARPLYLVHEVDRFKVVALPDYGDIAIQGALEKLPASLKPRWFGGPIVIGTRLPDNSKEREKVLFETMYGGRDYAQRPEYYVPFDEPYRLKVLSKSKPLSEFAKYFPEQGERVSELAVGVGLGIDQMRFVPVLHKEDWVAVMGPTGEIVGYLRGDGFRVP